jgi:hypothetical protein
MSFNRSTESRSRGRAVDNFVINLPILLDFSRPLQSLSNLFNEDVRRAIGNFRRVYRAAAQRFPQLRIFCHYATRSPTPPHANVEPKGRQVEEQLRRLFPDAVTTFEFLGARELLQLSRAQARAAHELRVTHDMSSAFGGYVALVRLLDYFDFITAGRELRNDLFEANVRDYQGDVGVNRKIKETLESPGADDFWWLNNGITIVGKRASMANKVLTIDNPQIVNGLQTSFEVFSYFRRTEQPEGSDRLVLVRVVTPGDDISYDRIIQATNSQTEIPVASIRATDEIQRKVEDFLRHHQLYYDRRKNQHKNQGKPKDSIISISYMAQALASIVLHKPDFARARPSTLLKEQSDYAKLFNPDHPMDIYLKAVLVMRRVDNFLKESPRVQTVSDRNNVRFHLATLAVSHISRRVRPTAHDIASLDLEDIDDDLLNHCLSDLNACKQELLATRPTTRPFRSGDQLCQIG